VRHLAQHAGERPFRCGYCHESFSTAAKQKEHIKRRHPIVHEQQAAAAAVASLSQVGNRILPSPARQYQPIAPAPANSSSVAARAQQSQARRVLPPILPALQTMATATAPAQQGSYLAQGANGAMYLVSNPIPQPVQQQPIFFAGNSGGNLPILMSNGQQLLQQPQQQTLLLNQGGLLQAAPVQTPVQQPLIIQATQMHQQACLPSSMPPAPAATPASFSTSSAMSSLLSPREAALLTASTPDAPTPEPSAEPLPGLGTEDGACLEIANPDGTVTVAPTTDIAFEMDDGSSSGVTLRTEGGRTVKLDILERAILEIPNLEEEVAKAPTPANPNQERQRLRNEPLAAQSGRENDKIEEGAEKEGSPPATDTTGGQISAGGANDSIAEEEDEEDEEVVEPWTPDPQGLDTEGEEEEARPGKQSDRRRASSVSSPRKSVCTSSDAGRGAAEETASSYTPSSSSSAIEAPFECERCGRRYKFANFLRVHQQRPCSSK